MNAVSRITGDIVSLRMSHCRAQHAAAQAQYHLAVRHYRECLEAAERREDCQAMEFFALRLAECYALMGFGEKARHFQALGRSGDALIG
ncbi:hypothetical protein [Deinococcus hohokamensis]|uniref:Uncharacterized protein n=1 Tax=Deinococcus hohokamensis TaxID=309883 RepID=A0ABV9IE71_9DEIO